MHGKRIAVSIVVLVLAMVPIVAQSETFYCNDQSMFYPTCCASTASCDGSYYSLTSTLCAIQCWEPDPNHPGRIRMAGSANCSPVMMCPVRMRHEISAASGTEVVYTEVRGYGRRNRTEIRTFGSHA